MVRTLRTVTTCCVAIGLLAACGGGDDDATDATTLAPPESSAVPTTAPSTTEPAPTTAPSTTEPAPTTTPATTEPPVTVPPTTEPPTTTTTTTTAADDPAVQLGGSLVAEDGLLTMQIAEGWSLDSLSETAAITYEDAGGLTWEPSIESLVEILSVTRDTAALAIPDADKVTLGVFREGRYRFVESVFEWDTAISGLLGISANIDVTVEWGGGRGTATRGRLGDRWVRHESVQVGDQFISVIAISPDQPTEQLDAEVSAMIGSIIVNPIQLDILAHSIDLYISASAEDTGSTPFELGFLAPPHWVEDDELSGYFYDPVLGLDPEAPLPSLDIYNQLVGGDDIATMTADEFAERGDDWFFIEPVPEDTVINGVPATIYWEGPAPEAEAALVIVSDGVLFVAAYIYTPGDPALLAEMVASAQVRKSAVNPDGL